jgi:5-formyltetrahydrofolate cyclo-ligase
MIGVPLISEKEMVFVEIRSLTECQPGSFGIREPAYSPEKVLRPEEIDVAVFPGLAFDTKKNRLGYGGGWYDRFLSKAGSHAVSIGVAYPFQVVEDLPSEPHDLPLSDVACCLIS